MYYTLHLTSECNLGCGYCYVDKQKPLLMSLETAKKAIDFIADKNETCGVSFFGGEPLLQKELIKRTVAYARTLEKLGRGSFNFNISTNGTLLDEAFIIYCTQNRVLIAMSIDGTKQAHDMYRTFKSGGGSYYNVVQNAIKLLEYQPYSSVMMVVNPDTLHFYADGVKSLFDLGFRYFVCTLNYDGKAGWTDEHMEELERQFEKIAKMYKRWTLDEQKFYFSPFDTKIRSHIDTKKFCSQRCQFGKRQISIDTDGRLYPCVQFAGQDEYCMGDVQSGIDGQKQQRMFEQSSKLNELCEGCVIEPRCSHTCGCLNMQATGSIGGVSPVLCAHERITLRIADRIADELYRQGSSMFMQKQYNDMFALISLIEDKGKRE